MNHLSEEQLVDAYYGEISERDALHIRECAECRKLSEQLREELDSIRTLPVPERGAGYGAEVWSRLRPQVRRKPIWMWVPAIAAMLAMAFLAGRWTKEKPVAETAAITEKARERVLLLSLSEHLERSQIVLTQLANATPGSDDLLEERDRARELVGANRLLRQTATRLGDGKDAAVLEELEHVLVEVANAPDAPTKADTLRVQERLADNGLLFKVRVTERDTRERGLSL